MFLLRTRVRFAQHDQRIDLPRVAHERVQRVVARIRLRITEHEIAFEQPGMAGRMVGVDPDNGSVRWEAPLASARGTNDVERLIDLVGGVSRQGSVVCARAFQAAVGCVDTRNGNLQWTKPANGATGVAGDGQRLFGAESDGRVLAWRADTGDRAWAAEHLQWRYLTGPLVLGRSVVVGDSTGLVHLLSREDGSPLTRLSTDGSGIAAAPVLAANTLVVVTRNGGVYGFVPE